MAALAAALPDVVGDRELVAVVSVLDDKDAAGMLRALIGKCRRWSAPPPATRARSRPPRWPRSPSSSAARPTEVVRDPHAAVRRAQSSPARTARCSRRARSTSWPTSSARPRAGGRRRCERRARPERAGDDGARRRRRGAGDPRLLRPRLRFRTRVPVTPRVRFLPHALLRHLRDHQRWPQPGRVGAHPRPHRDLGRAGLLDLRRRPAPHRRPDADRLRDRGVAVPVRGHDRLRDRPPAGVPRRRAPARAGDDGRRGAPGEPGLPAVPALRLRGQGRLPALSELHAQAQGLLNISYIHQMKNLLVYLVSCMLFCSLSATAQKTASPQGKLFVIGGGNRSPALMRSLVTTAGLEANDYVAVLPMSSSSPDTSYYYFKEDMKSVCANAVVNFNFTTEKINNRSWLDSLEKAKLVFITGGDQSRFMKVVLNTPVHKAIHKAYANGSTIAGTSAGAAVMCRYMITGNELTDTVYNATFEKIWSNNIEIKEGLGLTLAIIDQHFIVRSRYNRLLSALANYPSHYCIGIDETTAIIIQGNKVKVTGESQVIVLRKPKNLVITSTGLIKWKDIQFSIYASGDEFTFDPKN